MTVNMTETRKVKGRVSAPLYRHWGKVKCTLVHGLRLCTGRTAHRGSRGIALPFHDHGTRRGEGSASCPGRSLPRERPSTHYKGGWVGPRASLDMCGISRLPPGFDLRTVQPVASRYTDWTTRPAKFTYTLHILLDKNGSEVYEMFQFSR